MIKNKKNVISEFDNKQSRKFYKNLLGLIDKEELISMIEKELIPCLPDLIDYCLSIQDVNLIEKILVFYPKSIDDNTTLETPIF